MGDRGMSVGLQIGVETTKIFAPIARTGWMLGTLALREALEELGRSGSDGSTEDKLSDILGRHVIEHFLCTHFKGIVARSDRKLLSRFVRELVLESGAGPTITQAITGPNASQARLSMVIQISFLAWSHEHQSLGQALTQIVENGIKAGPIDKGLRLSYVALLGTIRACQQQTAAYSWEVEYKEVEQRLKSSISTTNIGNRSRKRPRSQASAQALLQSVSNRAIPFTPLQALIRWLDTVYRLPEEHLLEILTDNGVSSIVVWCYKILGLGVAIHLNSKTVYFGDEPYRITVRACGEDEVSATLLKPVALSPPIFRLSEEDLDPYIETDRRATARGFLKTVLELRGGKTNGLVHYGNWIVAKSISLFEQPPTHDFNNTTTLPAHEDHPGQSLPVSFDNEAEDGVSSVTIGGQDLREQIIPAVAFLLDLPKESLCTSVVPNALRRPGPLSALLPATLSLVFSFARVGDRDEASELPLSPGIFGRLDPGTLPITQPSKSQLAGGVPNVTACFDLICRLLLGRGYTAARIEKASLVSDRGWSVFFGSMDATDPAHVPSESLFIKLGVPAMDGLRKSRIVDGMTGYGITSNRGIRVPDDNDDVAFWPDVWHSKLVGTHVGEHELDAFAVVQTYDWASGLNGCRKWRLGFREKQDMCASFSTLDSCLCPIESESNRRRTLDELIWPAASVTDSPASPLTLAYPENILAASKTPERVFTNGSAWFFFVTGDGAARWLGMDGVYMLGSPRKFLRGTACCVKCAIRAVTIPALVLL